MALSHITATSVRTQPPLQARELTAREIQTLQTKLFYMCCKHLAINVPVVLVRAYVKGSREESTAAFYAVTNRCDDPDTHENSLRGQLLVPGEVALANPQSPPVAVYITADRIVPHLNSVLTVHGDFRPQAAPVTGLSLLKDSRRSHVNKPEEDEKNRLVVAALAKQATVHKPAAKQAGAAAAEPRKLQPVYPNGLEKLDLAAGDAPARRYQPATRDIAPVRRQKAAAIAPPARVSPANVFRYVSRHEPALASSPGLRAALEEGGLLPYASASDPDFPSFCRPVAFAASFGQTPMSVSSS